MINLTPPSTAFGGPPTDHPLMLFPVRLETRFAAEADGPKLLVRVYVEDLAVDWHQPGLSSSELEWGRAFWEQVWRSGSNEARRQAAWRQLTERFGAPRAAWIAEALLPTNDAKRPPTEIATDAAIHPTPNFPEAPKPVPGGARTHVMPDRWIATGWIGNRRAFTYAGRPIARDPLQVGPSTEAARGFDARSLAADPELGWLVDFDAAEEVGMGLRIPFSLPASARLDRLLVFGARGTLAAADGAARIEDLLRAHRYTDGLSFVTQGTPTNNTAAASSGFDSLADQYQTSPTAAAPPYAAGDGSNRDVLARALGIDDAILARVAGSAAPEQRDAYHMNTLLWKAGLGYALEHLMEGPNAPSADDIRLGREHFSSYVRARGPLPAIRVGRQPFGLLPAISLDRWQPREGGAIDAPLHRFLVALREVWRRGLPSIPKVPLSDNPSAELVRVLAMTPGAVGYTTRRAARLAQIATGTRAPAATPGSSRALDLARSLGITWAPRAIRTIVSIRPGPGRITGGIVQKLEPGTAAETLSERDLPSPNHLGAMAADGYRVVTDAGTPPAPATSETLLQLLARQAERHEYLAAAYRILGRRNAVTPDERLEPDLTGDGTSRWALLTRTIDTGGGARALGTVLDGLRVSLRNETDRDVAAPGAIWRRRLYEVAPGKGGTPDVAPDVSELAAFVRAVRYLATRPSAVLARALTETLDLGSHRFDAWVTSLATKRMEWLRGRQSRGAYVGGYGWVEDLAPTRRETAPTLVVDPPQSPAPPELADPLYQWAGSHGYVHAPSLSHGTTAAILRSGYLSRRNTGDGNALAINLSSGRVRTAMWLLDGVRQGQSLASLLGYRFERVLHENHPDLVLDRYILTFRRISSPSVAIPSRDLPTWATTINALPASAVVDGLALLRKHREAADSPQRIPWGIAGLLPNTGTDVWTACRDELDVLADILDAVADLVLAESVHHVAQGNPVRAGATLEAVAHGEAPPPDIDVVRTPRTGIGMTHRLVVLLDANSAGAAWGPKTPRALAEPYLNDWVAHLLGPDAPNARCRVELVSGDSDPIVVELTLKDLGLAPIDLVSLPEQDESVGRSELEQRVIRYALTLHPPGEEKATITLQFGRRPDWPSGTPGFAEILETVRVVRRTIQGARELSGQDLSLPGAAVPATVDAEPASVPAALRLSSRAQAAADGLRTASQSIDTLVDPKSPEPDATKLRDFLLLLASYGIPGAMPVEPVGDTPLIRSQLRTQATSVAREAARRLLRLDDVETRYAQRVAELAEAIPASQPAPSETRAYHLERLTEVFGPDFRALAPFIAANGADLRSTLAASATLQANKPLEAVTWLQRTARVRDGASRLHATMIRAEALGGSSMNFAVGQLPHITGDRWVGLPLTDRQDGEGGPPRPPGGRLSLVMHTPGAVDATQPVAGLLIDEWTETVPSPEETTGLVFHYDQPSARAPHTILLAVSPDDRPTWDFETLETTLLETLDLAKLRTVDLAALPEVSPFLPALYFAEGDHDRAVTSNFDGIRSQPA
jgi:hypothetical protein